MAGVGSRAPARSLGTNRCEETGSRTATKQIAGSFVFYQNADSDSGFGPPVPACAWAGMTITSDVPIIVVAALVNDMPNNPGDTDSMFNAFPKR